MEKMDIVEKMGNVLHKIAVGYIFINALIRG